MSGRGLRWCLRETKVVTLFVAFVLAAGLQNAAAKQQADTDVAAAAAAERGRKEFVQSCGFCHGADATGARGPDLMRSPLVMHDVKGNLIGDVIRQGEIDKGITGMPLGGSPIRELEAFLHRSITEAARAARVPEM